jgi:hypothetical protein
MAEHLFCKQVVAGSNPIAGSSLGDAIRFRGGEHTSAPRLPRRAITTSGQRRLRAEGIFCPMV